MATTYKTLLADDITPVRSKLQTIPVTGSIISGTYGDNVLLPDNPQTGSFIRTTCLFPCMIILI